MLPVLAYHKIDQPTPDVKIRGAYTSPKRFRKQMSYLKRHGFVFYTAGELIRHYRENGAFPAKGIAITFDDGWKDNYVHAFPVMRDLGIKATIFLVPSVIGQTSDVIVAEGEGPREHMSRENIIEMSQYGIEFGSHSLNHVHLHKAAPNTVEYEVTESKSQIENLTQASCEVFAYPAGFFNDTAKEKVENAGYIAAFSTVYGSDENIDLYALNRVEILRRDRMPFRFAKKITSIFD